MATMFRLRKSEKQVKILTELLKEYNGEINVEFRKKAQQKTGLQWIKIYKWVFDKKARDRMSKTFTPLNDEIPIFRIINKHGRDITKPPRPIPGITKPKVIFKVERAPHLVLRNSIKEELC